MRTEQLALSRSIVIATAMVAGVLTTNVVRAQDQLASDSLIKPTLFDQFRNVIQRAAQATAAKAAFNEEIKAARARFFAGCSRGVRDPAAASNFASLLLQKDIYYLSQYLYEGVTPSAQKHVNATDTLTGGALDGGLTTIGLFGDWTEAVRREMHAPPSGQFWLPLSPADALDAIQAAAAQYVAYQQTRDRHEFEQWRMSQRKPAGTPANTPEERADRYAEYILEPEIQQTIDDLPENQRAEANSRLTEWAAQLRQAIIGFERLDATPDLVTDYLRDSNFPEDIIQSTQANLSAMHPANASAANAAAVVAIGRARQQRDARRDPRAHPLEPNLSVIDLDLHSYAYANGAGRLTAEEAAKLPLDRSHNPNRLGFLFIVARPPYKCRTFYSLPRKDIMSGVIYKEPPPPPPGVDPCTGRPVGQAVLGSAPEPAPPLASPPPALASAPPVPEEIPSLVPQPLTSTPAAVPNAGQRLQSGAYGPDVLGLALGMGLGDAERIVRSKLEVGRVLDLADDAGSAPMRGRMFISKDDQQRIAVFFAASADANILVGIWRYLQAPRPFNAPWDQSKVDQLWANVQSDLIQKYGPATDRLNGALDWAEPRGTGAYRCRLNTAPRSWPNWTENGQPTNLGGTADVPMLILPTEDPANCGTFLSVKFNDGWQRKGVVTMPLVTSLTDLGVARLLATRPPTPSPGSNSHSGLKF